MTAYAISWLWQSPDHAPFLPVPDPHRPAAGQPPAQADTYTYDVFGNLSTLSSDRGTRSFTYDEINRLKTETGFTGTRAHTYDANTNRTSDGATPPTLLTYTPASNRIATANGVTLTHDEAGNLLADGLYTYTWDEAGHLKTVSKNGTLLATYAYDHRNRRSRKSTTAAAPQGAQTILYHYDQDDHLIAETRSDGTPLRTYVWLAERPLTVIEHAAVANPPRSLHLQHDHLGTPRLAKNDAGVIQWRWDSDGYGTTTPTHDPDGDGKATVINLRFRGSTTIRRAGSTTIGTGTTRPGWGGISRRIRLGLREGPMATPMSAGIH